MVTPQVVVDTCPVCEQTCEVPTTGAWIDCPAPGCPGRLRWVPDEDADAHIGLVNQRLQAEIEELRRWVAEGLSGAAEGLVVAMEKMSRIRGRTGG